MPKTSHQFGFATCIAGSGFFSSLLGGVPDGGTRLRLVFFTVSLGRTMAYNAAKNNATNIQVMPCSNAPLFAGGGVDNLSRLLFQSVARSVFSGGDWLTLSIGSTVAGCGELVTDFEGLVAGEDSAIGAVGIAYSSLYLRSRPGRFEK